MFGLAERGRLAMHEKTLAQTITNAHAMILEMIAGVPSLPSAPFDVAVVSGAALRVRSLEAT